MVKAKNILTLNVGSSSVKCKVFSGKKEIFSASYERVKQRHHRREVVADILKKLEWKLIRVDAIAHRIVHGGSISETKRVTPALLKKLYSIAELAPLHDIPEIEVIESCLKHFKVKQFAVFDTAFHQTMPDEASVYGLPYSLFSKGIRRYGFHGTSVKYVSRGLTGKVIVCHLGSGASVTAVKNGKSVDTSMGFTPLEGLVMGTRSGSIDPAIIPYLLEHERMTMKEIKHLLNHDSGLLGISGTSNDMRDLLSSKAVRSQLAVDVFVHWVVKYIGGYAGVMNGVDTIVFTAGIGERSPTVRKKICDRLGFLGLQLDMKKNKANKEVVSLSRSKVKVMVIPTNEELAMALEVNKLV